MNSESIINCLAMVSNKNVYLNLETIKFIDSSNGSYNSVDTRANYCRSSLSF